MPVHPLVNCARECGEFWIISGGNTLHTYQSLQDVMKHLSINPILTTITPALLKYTLVLQIVKRVKKFEEEDVEEDTDLKGKSSNPPNAGRGCQVPSCIDPTLKHSEKHIPSYPGGQR